MSASKFNPLYVQFIRLFYPQYFCESEYIGCYPDIELRHTLYTNLHNKFKLQLQKMCELNPDPELFYNYVQFLDLKSVRNSLLKYINTAFLKPIYECKGIVFGGFVRFLEFPQNDMTETNDFKDIDVWFKYESDLDSFVQSLKKLYKSTEITVSDITNRYFNKLFINTYIHKITRVFVNSSEISVSFDLVCSNNLPVNDYACNLLCYDYETESTYIPQNLDSGIEDMLKKSYLTYCTQNNKPTKMDYKEIHHIIVSNLKKLDIGKLKSNRTRDLLFENKYKYIVVSLNEMFGNTINHTDKSDSEITLYLKPLNFRLSQLFDWNDSVLHKEIFNRVTDFLKSLETEFTQKSLNSIHSKDSNDSNDSKESNDSVGLDYVQVEKIISQPDITKEYNPNGKLEFQLRYKDGVNVERIEFYELGGIKRTQIFKNSILVYDSKDN